MNTLGTCLSRIIYIPHEVVSTRHSMIQFHLETICYHVICLDETHDVICNDLYLCFHTKLSIRLCHAWYASRTSSFRHDTVWYIFISRRYAVISFVCTNHSTSIVTICIHVSAPNTLGTCLPRMICIPHDFASTRYGMIQLHLEMICCHVICLHETLDVYCNDIYSCFRTKHSIRVCPAWYASRTNSFQYETVWCNCISRRDAVMSFVCTNHLM